VSAQPSLFDLIERRLHEHYASTQPRNVGYPAAVKNAILGGINLPFEAGRHIGGDITGSLYAMSAQDTRASNPLDARIAAAYDQGGPAAAFEAAQTDPRKEVSLTAGAIGMLTDPTMLVGGPLGKLGKVGEIADTVLSTPFRPLEVALGRVGRRAIAPAVLRAREALYGATEGVAGNVPKSAGLIGPVPPPPLRTPPLEPAAAPSIIDLARGAPIRPAVPKVAPLPEGLVPTRTPSLVGLARQRGRAAGAELAQRVTPAQERAAANVESLAPEAIAPQEAAQTATGALPGAAPTTREAGLAALSGRDTNTLLSVAYDHPNAVANAQRKYGDVGALRARAIERIQADRGRVARLAEADPDLAARVAALPDAEAAGGVGKAEAISPTPPAPAAATLPWIDALAARLGKQPWQLTESEVARAVPSTTGFDVDALHYKKHPLGGRTYAVPESGVVTLYHNTNVEPAGFLTDGIKPAEHDSIFAHQTPLPDPVHRFTVEFEAPITGPDATMHPSGGRLTGADAYANPALNTYRTDFDYYGVWTGRRTVPAENIKRIRDNFTGEMVYDRDLGGGITGTVSARYPNPPDRGATPFVYRDVHRDIVEQALREGKPVPPDVLADMPDLAEKYAPKAGGDLAAGGGGGMMVVTPLAAARTLGPGAVEASGRALSNLGITGTDLRAAGRAGMARMRAARATEAAGIATPAQATAAGVDRYTRGARGPVEAVNDFLNQTRGVVVATWKNQVLDVLHTRGMLREFAPIGSDPAGTGDRILDELRANEGAADAYGKLSDTARTTLEGWGFKGFLPDLGQGQVGALAQEEPGRILPATQRVINGMVMELRTKGPVGLLTFPVGGARGYFAPFLDAFFERLNRLPQRAGRETLYTLTGDANSFLAAHNFLGNLAQRGVDVTSLAGRRFTPEEVEAVAGTQAAHEWRSLLATVWGGAEAETKRVLGDFGQKTALEKVPLIGRMFWLAGWSQRMLPVYAQVAARHPGASMAVGGALADQAQGLKDEGLPPWAVGGVDTPIGRVNLLSPMPFSGELAGDALSALGGGGDEGDRQTGYQKFKGIAGGLGLPINPLIETGAYIAGQTGNQRPGNFDRYAGPMNLLPGPTVGIDYGAMLDKARQIVTGLGEGDLAAGKKPPASETDKEWNRLVAERTGLVASDPRNIGAIIDVQTRDTDPDTLAAKWYREAEANVKARQGKQGVVSAVSPLTISRIDPLQRAAAIGRQDQPYSYQQISAAYDSGNRKAAALMQQLNSASKAPNQRVYDAASESQRVGLVKGFLDQQRAVRRVQVSGDPYGLHNRPHGAGLP
jgi:hypothetical protein